jgi:hypothetical protein
MDRIVRNLGEERNDTETQAWVARLPVLGVERALPFVGRRAKPCIIMDS